MGLGYFAVGREEDENEERTCRLRLQENLMELPVGSWINWIKTGLSSAFNRIVKSNSH